MDPVLEEALRRARGARPQFTSDPLIDRLFAICVGLATELAVTRQRLDTLERVLARSGHLDHHQIESYEPTPSEAAERGAQISQLLAVAFRTLLETSAESPEQTSPPASQAKSSPAA